MKKAIEYQNKIEQHLKEYRETVAKSLRTTPGTIEYSKIVEREAVLWDTLTKEYFYSKESLCDIITEEGKKHTKEKLKKRSYTA